MRLLNQRDRNSHWGIDLRFAKRRGGLLFVTNIGNQPPTLGYNSRISSVQQGNKAATLQCNLYANDPGIGDKRMFIR